MKITDPIDKKTNYPSITALVTYYSKMAASEILGRVLDQLGDRPDMQNPSATIEVSGTGANATIAHGLKDADGNKVKPRAVQILGWSGCDSFNVISTDDTNITFYATNTAKVKLALFA